MTKQERIDHLLLDIRELEKKIVEIREAEVYPVSFFSQSYEMAHKLLTDLHTIETEQLEYLSRQMEEHRQHIGLIPPPQATTSSLTKEEPSGKIQEEEQKPSIVEEIKTETVIIHQTTEPIVTLETAEKPNPEIVSKEEKTIVEKKFLNEVIIKKNLTDFRKAFSLNDRFLFRRELFGGDDAKMNKTIAELDTIDSYEESISYIKKELLWDLEDPTVASFLSLLEKRFL